MTRDEIQGRLDVLRDNLEKLALIPQVSLDEFCSDFRNLDSALYRLQTSIQALIDVGAHVVAYLGLPAPTSSRKILESLEHAGRIPSGSTRRYGPILGFRNRIVHRYDRIDAAIVYRILREESGDLAELFDLLLAAIDGGTGPTSGASPA